MKAQGKQPGKETRPDLDTEERKSKLNILNRMRDENFMDCAQLYLYYRMAYKHYE